MNSYFENGKKHNFPEKYQVLQKVFGYSSFRKGQEHIIDTLLSHRDLVAILPTGGGKSICFQIPALLFPGMTLVISPLISLIQDQVAALQRRGIPAAGLTSLQSSKEQKKTLSLAIEGRLKLLYLAPERLETPSFRAAASSMKISFLCIDEAHCISQWGREFRPSYRHIPDFVSSLSPQRPVIAAFTATASPEIRDDIIRLLHLQNPSVITAGFDRPNLYYEVRHTKNKWDTLLHILPKYRGQSGIIYCRTRSSVEHLVKRLNRVGIPSLRYHAGLDPKERQKNQELWLNGSCLLIVATNAFGMGIDKPDVRYVIHYNMPQDIESYEQEAGRAGRDGLPSDCILLFHDRDPSLNRFFIERASSPEVRSLERRKLHEMQKYAGAQSCLRQMLLQYFGEHAPDYCGNCSVCLSKGRFQTAPVSYLIRGRESQRLYRDLKSVRARLSREHKRPPEKICSDAVLHELAARRPLTFRDLFFVEGMDPVRCKKYGTDFLSEIRAFLSSHHEIAEP